MRREYSAYGSNDSCLPKSFFVLSLAWGVQIGCLFKKVSVKILACPESWLVLFRVMRVDRS
jgi:hypothetical protein